MDILTDLIGPLLVVAALFALIAAGLLITTDHPAPPTD